MKQLNIYCSRKNKHYHFIVALLYKYERTLQKRGRLYC